MSVKYFMSRALELATYAIKNCRPNPAVGAVVVKNGVVVGEGYTMEPGNSHAEISALKNAGENSKDASLYVSLEPCCHYGRTPPCADAIIKAGIKKVYYGYIDPNSQVTGNGIEKLKQAGIETIKENLNGQIDNFYESYAWFVKNKSPFVTLKIAQTMDGFIANINKTPLKITGEKSKKELHALRSFCDAVVIGGGTVRFDNPSLTVREANGANPLRIVFNGKGELPCEAKIFNDNLPTIIYKANFESFSENWNFMLSDFSKKGMHHILVEAGATLAKNLFSMPNSFQRFLLWTSPLRLGNGLLWNKELKDWQKNFTLRKTYMQGNDFCEEFILAQPIP